MYSEKSARRILAFDVRKLALALVVLVLATLIVI